MKSALRRVMRWSSRLVGRMWLRASALALPRTAEDEVDAWASGLKAFFILGIGRSGSMFLAHLLDRAAGSIVCHEPIRTDFAAYIEAFYDQRKAIEYVRGFRQKEIYARIRDENPAIYGEVNTNLRRHGAALREAFPHVTLIHLVRDGRDVVRSMM